MITTVIVSVMSVPDANTSLGKQLRGGQTLGKPARGGPPLGKPSLGRDRDSRPRKG